MTGTINSVRHIYSCGAVWLAVGILTFSCHNKNWLSSPPPPHPPICAVLLIICGERQSSDDYVADVLLHWGVDGANAKRRMTRGSLQSVVGKVVVVVVVVIVCVVVVLFQGVSKARMPQTK